MQLLERVPEAGEVRRELELILASPVFRGSKRCQDFLRYVATKSLEGAAGTLKERTLAMEVFGREASLDGSDDSIVRVGAREVRKRLAQYYVTDGAHDPIRIDLPSGSYVPAFHYQEGESETAAAGAVIAPVVEQLPAVVDAPARGRGRWFLAAAAALLLAVIAALAVRSYERRASLFHVFWAPVLNAATPVIIVLPHPIVYHPSSRASRLDKERNGDARLPVQRALDVPPQLLTGSDFVPVLDQYVGFGDAVAALRMTTLLAQSSRYPKYRLASKVEFNDLRDATPILIGAFTNRWTAEITKAMRYQFAFRDGKPGIVDRSNGQVWSLASKMDNGRSTEDYLLICRLPHSATGGMMMIGAGINVYGTEEAGRILADPDLLTPILRRLPKDWETNNLEFVLHVEVVGDAPALPEVVATQIWK